MKDLPARITEPAHAANHAANITLHAKRQRRVVAGAGRWVQI